MILLVAVAVWALGFVAWITGTVFEFYGLAAIGGTLVLGVGAVIAVDGGIEHRVGHTEAGNTEMTNVSYEYDTVETTSSFSVSFLSMLLGGVMVLRAIGGAGSAAEGSF